MEFWGKISDMKIYKNTPLLIFDDIFVYVSLFIKPINKYRIVFSRNQYFPRILEHLLSIICVIPLH